MERITLNLSSGGKLHIYINHIVGITDDNNGVTIDTINKSYRIKESVLEVDSEIYWMRKKINNKKLV